jgi:hypothetical protein
MIHWRRWTAQLAILALTAQVVLGCLAAVPAGTPAVSSSPGTPASVSTETSSPTVTAGPSLDSGIPSDGLPTTEPADPATEERGAEEPETETDALRTLGTLEQVDAYPLYVMRYYGPYGPQTSRLGGVEGVSVAPSRPIWACSLFAALGDGEKRLYGRNFDWRYSPGLLLFTDPPDGYASVSMVDIGYLVPASEVKDLMTLPLEAREPLLEAPFWPFDGMNEHGLVVGMAAVPESKMPYDASRETIDSLGVIREMLDHARDVDEAVAILGRYNVEWDGGPALHYLIADASGRSILVEFYAGEMILVDSPGGKPWHLATNHLRSTIGEGDPSGCWRYDTVEHRLATTEGSLTVSDALDLLAEVAQENTQWSVVYNLSVGRVHVAMGRGYKNEHVFSLRP